MLLSKRVSTLNKLGWFQTRSPGSDKELAQQLIEARQGVKSLFKYITSPTRKNVVVSPVDLALHFAHIGHNVPKKVGESEISRVILDRSDLVADWHSGNSGIVKLAMEDKVLKSKLIKMVKKGEIKDRSLLKSIYNIVESNRRSEVPDAELKKAYSALFDLDAVVGSVKSMLNGISFKSSKKKDERHSRAFNRLNGFLGSMRDRVAGDDVDLELRKMLPKNKYESFFNYLQTVQFEQRLKGEFREIETAVRRQNVLHGKALTTVIDDEVGKATYVEAILKDLKRLGFDEKSVRDARGVLEKNYDRLLDADKNNYVLNKLHTILKFQQRLRLGGKETTGQFKEMIDGAFENLSTLCENWKKLPEDVRPSAGVMVEGFALTEQEKARLKGYQVLYLDGKKTNSFHKDKGKAEESKGGEYKVPAAMKESMTVFVPSKMGRVVLEEESAGVWKQGDTYKQIEFDGEVVHRLIAKSDDGKESVIAFGHFASAARKDRERIGVNLAKKLNALISELKEGVSENAHIQFSADINALLFTHDPNTGQLTLREGVSEVLKAHNLVMKVAKGKYRSGKAQDLQEQTHKLKYDSKGEEAGFDTMVHFESVDSNRDYQRESVSSGLGKGAWIWTPDHCEDPIGHQKNNGKYPKIEEFPAFVEGSYMDHGIADVALNGMDFKGDFMAAKKCDSTQTLYEEGSLYYAMGNAQAIDDFLAIHQVLQMNDRRTVDWLMHSDAGRSALGDQVALEAAGYKPMVAGVDQYFDRPSLMRFIWGEADFEKYVVPCKDYIDYESAPIMKAIVRFCQFPEGLSGFEAALKLSKKDPKGTVDREALLLAANERVEGETNPDIKRIWQTLVSELRQ